LAVAGGCWRFEKHCVARPFGGPLAASRQGNLRKGLQLEIVNMGRKSMWQFSERIMPRGVLSAQEHHVSDPICFARNDLPIELWHLVVAPGAPRCGTKWQFWGHFSSDCPLVYTATAGTPTWVVRRGLLRRSTVKRQPTSCVRAVDPFTSFPTFILRARIDSRSRPRAGCRLMRQQADDLRSGRFLKKRTRTGVRDAHR
jgi:hypothetical protein